MPPLDPELLATMAVQPAPRHDFLSGDLAPWRERYASQHEVVAAAVGSGLVARRDLWLESAPDEPGGVRSPRPVSVLRPAGSEAQLLTGLVFAHGGGLLAGDRFTEGDLLVDWCIELGIAVITVDYGLIPEHDYEQAVDDLYGALRWASRHGAEIGIDPGRLLVGGMSAGGGLAAACAQQARDEHLPVAGQLLLAPMLDDRDATASAEQCTIGPWTRAANAWAWRAAGLGPGSSTLGVAAPARATDYRGLAPAYLEVGSSEVFRDEAVAYASRIWEAGGQAELHVWAGGSHGFDAITHTAIAQAAMRARDSWLRRVVDESLGQTARSTWTG